MDTTLIFAADDELLVHDICITRAWRPRFEGWQVRLWNLRERRKVADFPGKLMGVSLDGRGILTRFGYKDNEFRAYDAHDGAVLERAALADAPFRFNQRYILRYHESGQAIALVDGLGVEPIREIPFEKTNDLSSRVLSPDGQRFAALYEFDSAGFDAAWGYCFDITGRELFKFKDVNRFAAPPLVVFADHHPLLSVEATAGTMLVYNILTGHVTHRLGFLKAGSFVAFSPQSPPLIAYHCDTTSWCLVDGDNPRKIEVEESIVGGAFSQDGARFALLFENGHIHIYRMADLTVELMLPQA